MNTQTNTPTAENAATTRTAARPRNVHVPRVDVHESAEGFLVIADLPGVAQENVEVTVDKDVLTISARTETRVPTGYQRLYGAEPVDAYERSFGLTDAVDREGISATMTNGTLRLVLPKARAAQPRRISVATAA